MSEQNLGSIWTLIWPEWGALARGGVEAVTPALVLVIWGVTAFTIWWVTREARRAGRCQDAVDTLLEGVDRTNLWARRAEIGRRAENLPDDAQVVKDAWREFDETLVADDAARQVWNTVEAESFFNEHRFAPRLVGNRFLSAAPTVLTTLGLLGTFLGLTVGLRHLDLNADTEALQSGIQTLVDGAALGFTASLWGVAMSLVTNVVDKWIERHVVRRVRKQQDRIDALFTLRSPEHSLSSIATSSEASAAALAELHEKIGARLQEAVEGIAESTRSAVSESIESSLAPVMQDLASRAANQSAEIFERIADQLTTSFQHVGTSLSEGLQRSSDELRGTLEYMADKLSEQADQYREQMASLQAATARQVELLDESLPRVAESLETAAARVGAATERLEASAEHLGSTATSFESVSVRFADFLTDSVKAFEEMSAKNTGAAGTLETLSQKMVDLTGTATAASDGLRESADALRGGFATLQDHQEAFLADLERRLAKQAEDMSGWLAAYSDEVSRHTARRMDEWNLHTEAFTSTMLRATQALSDAVDEIDAVRGANVEPQRDEAEAA